MAIQEFGVIMEDGMVIQEYEVRMEDGMAIQEFEVRSRGGGGRFRSSRLETEVEFRFPRNICRLLTRSLK